MLTSKQKQLLTYLNAYGDRHDGVMPSFREMTAALGLRSRSNIFRLLESLEERGAIRRLPHRARAIEILARPDAVEAAVPGEPREVQVPGGCVRIALIGGGSASVPGDVVGPGEHVGLRVRGRSVAALGILDGDLAVLRRQDVATPGRILAAGVDGGAPQLWQCSLREGRILLAQGPHGQPERPFDPDRVRIAGRLVGLVRDYRQASLTGVAPTG